MFLCLLPFRGSDFSVLSNTTITRLAIAFVLVEVFFCTARGDKHSCTLQSHSLTLPMDALPRAVRAPCVNVMQVLHEFEKFLQSHILA